MCDPRFPTVEAAWFWTMASIEARHDPGRRPPGPGPCLPETVTRCLDELYRSRRIVLLHARILRVYGRRGRAPDPRRAGERCDWRLWHEAMLGLEPKLRRRNLLQPAWGTDPATPPGAGFPTHAGPGPFR